MDEVNKNGWGGVREGAGRKRTALDGEARKQRQVRSTDTEWILLKQVLEIVRKDPERVQKLIDEYNK